MNDSKETTTVQEIMEPTIKYREKLVKSGPQSYLYVSSFYPDIKIQVHYFNEDRTTVTAECNLIDLSDEIIRPWFLELDGDLDLLAERINKEYGESVPGFENNNDDDEKEWDYVVDPLFSHLKWNPERDLVIYTWGKKHRDNKPKESQCNFNAAIISGRKKDINLKKINGLSFDVQKGVKAGKGYAQFMEYMIGKIEQDDLHTISINCIAGKHRSVSCAEILKREFYPKTAIYHMELNKHT